MWTILIGWLNLVAKVLYSVKKIRWNCFHQQRRGFTFTQKKSESSQTTKIHI